MPEGYCTTAAVAVVLFLFVVVRLVLRRRHSRDSNALDHSWRVARRWEDLTKWDRWQ